MTKNQLNDFAATLTAQLKDAARQMRAMRQPPDRDDEDVKSDVRLAPTSKKATSPIKECSGADKKISSNLPSKDQEKNNVSFNKPRKTSKDDGLSTGQKQPTTPLTPAPSATERVPDSPLKDSRLSSVTVDDSNKERRSPTPPLEKTDFYVSTLSKNYDASEKNQNLERLAQLPRPSLASTPEQPLIYNEYANLQFSNLKHLIQARGTPSSTESRAQTVDDMSKTVPARQLQSITPGDSSMRADVPWGSYNPQELHDARLSTTALGGARQLILDALIQLRSESPQVAVNLKRLATILGLSYGTVRNTVSRLVREGVIYTTQIRAGDVHGVHIEFSETTSALRSTTTKASPTAQANAVWDADLETISLLWPCAAAAGLCPAHLERLRKAYVIQGFDETRVAKHLRYLDWRIETETFDDPVASTTLLQQWLQIMRQKGGYPQPEGYAEQSRSSEND